jgi:outer membrane protein assembly factor BamB
MAIFGSADGWVYCLRAQDGKLAWKLRAAPIDRRIMVRGQLESLWPVPGSVLIDNGTLYFAAGRNTHLDSGLFYYAADPVTGQIKWKGQAGRESGESNNDIMIRGKEAIHLGHRVHFDPGNGTISKNSANDNVIYAPFGLLVDTLAHACSTTDTLRKQWAYGRVNTSAEPQDGVRTGKRSAVIAVDNGTVYSVTETYRGEYKAKQDQWITLRNLRMYCSQPDGKDTWSIDVEPHNRMRALISTADLLIFAVQPEGKAEGELWFVSKTDGKKLKTIPVDSVPRWDGLAVAEGKLFVVTDTGEVLCFK